MLIGQLHRKPLSWPIEKFKQIKWNARQALSVILLEKECNFSGADNVSGGDTQTLLDGKKIKKNFMHHP